MRKESSDFTPELNESLCSTGLNAIRGTAWEADPASGPNPAEMQRGSDEERYRLAMQAADDGLYDWNLLTNEVYYSPRWKAMLGYGAEELENRLETWLRLMHPEDRDVTMMLVRDYLRGGIDRYRTEVRLRHKSGHYITVLSRASLSRDANGNAVRMVGTHVDLSDLRERKELAQDLKLHEHFQRALLDSFPFAAWMKDEEGRYRDANKLIAAYYGLSSPEELLGKSAHDFLPPDVAEQIEAEAREVLGSGRTKRSERQLPVNGGDHWFDFHQAPISIDGQCFGIVGCAWDITERKLMEKALAESEERYRKVVEFSPEAMFVHYQGRFVFLNLAAAKLLGASDPEELHGRRALDFVHPDLRDAVARRIENAWQHNDNPLIEEQLLRLDGSTVLVEMVSVHFIYKGMDSVLAIARDISERKRMQDELVRTQKLESLGVLAGGIAHDFNNILTGILGNLSLVRMQLDTPEAVARGLERCEKAALRASELTQQLLTFARGGDPVRRVVDPVPLIRESVSFVLRGSNLGTELALADDLWCIEADPGQLNQALGNILINSKQAMPDGGIIRITSSNEELGPDGASNLPAGNYLKISIEDQGDGIPPVNLPKIFDPFFTTKQQGNGLGLASVYSIVKRHGGEVAVSSSMGAGSCFTIHLPAVPGKRSGNQKPERRELQSGKGRVLVMDDEEIIRELATTTLEFAGYQVVSCGDGAEAVERYRSSYRSDPFDVVIMDLTIPGGMGGKEAAGIILGFDPDASLIVSSGYSNDPVMANFRQFGFRGAVVKPFSAGELTAEVHRLSGLDLHHKRPGIAQGV